MDRPALKDSSAAERRSIWLNSAVLFYTVIAFAAVLFVGLAITMALGLYVAQVFNIISIAFVALFVGIGVDFGIQFCVRYRHERFVGFDLAGALKGAGRGVGKPLARIFSQFEGYSDPTSTLGSGDVKYHLGARGVRRSPAGNEIVMAVAPNPSAVTFRPVRPSLTIAL